MDRFRLQEAETATLARVSLTLLRRVLHEGYTPSQKRTFDDLESFLTLAERSKTRGDLYTARAS